MAVDVLRALGGAIVPVHEAPEANRPPGVVYAKCALKYCFGAAWAFGTAYILGKYNADPQQMINIFQNIALPAGVILMGISKGCLKLALQAESLSSLKELWERYTQGVLQNALSQALLTPDLLHFAEQGKDVELEVQIDKRIYQEACLDLMVKSVLQVQQNGTNTSLSHRSCSLSDVSSESNINLILNATHSLKELSLEAKAQIKQETQPKIIDPLPAEPTDTWQPSERLPNVLFLSLIDDEKVFLKKKKAREKQRIIDGEVKMLAKHKRQISSIRVWVFREPEAAKLCKDQQGKQELPVQIKKGKNLETSFSVDLNDISTGPDKPFYALATSHVTRLNMFQLSSVLYFEDGTENEEFFSKPFRITTTPLPKAATTSVSSPIPSPEFRNTHIEVQTLVSDLVFASHVKVKNMTSKPSLDLGADKSMEKSFNISKVCTDLVRADYLIAHTIIYESISTSTESEDIQGRLGDRLVETRPRTRSDSRYVGESTSSHITARTITVERLIVRCLTHGVIQGPDA